MKSLFVQTPPLPSAPMLAQAPHSIVDQLAQLLTAQQTPGTAPGMGMSPSSLAPFAGQPGDSNSGLLGGAMPGMPNWVNALQFSRSGAGGVNPYTYGMGATPGGTDTAGNFQV